MNKIDFVDVIQYLNKRNILAGTNITISVLRELMLGFAQEQVKNLNIPVNLPPVIKSVCPYCGRESNSVAEPRKYKCGNCNRLFYEQTVL